jgi:hypothetical protein
LDPKGENVTGGWRKLHDEERHNLYLLLATQAYYGHKIKKNEMEGISITDGEGDKYKSLVG